MSFFLKSQPDPDKLRGGYYTPETIAEFVCEWAIRQGDERILEPSCGDGNILAAAASRVASLGAKTPRIYGVEFLAEEAAKASARLKTAKLDHNVSILNEDYFTFASRKRGEGVTYDVVVGNPPFVRYQDFPEDQRNIAFALMREMGLSPSKLTNLWLPFLAVATSSLSAGGRLGMVIPAELFQVGYAAELRQFLADHFKQIDIVTFKQLVFPTIQQEVVLLLAEKRSGAVTGIRVHEVDNAADLPGLSSSRMMKQAVKPVDHAEEKWTKYFLEKDEILLLRTLREREDVDPLGKHVSVDVGVVTGNNDYFLLSEEEVAEHELHDDCVPLVGRSLALQGTRFTSSDFNRWAELGKKCHLFLPRAPYGTAAANFVGLGEEAKVDEGYKCSIRKEWFRVPSVWTPDFFFLRQADSSPRIVANTTSATCTDTLHRGRLLTGVNKNRLCAAFTNSLTFATSEVIGRSYGGGVMTFEPSEVEKLPLPLLNSELLDWKQIDRLVREKKLEEALDVVDEIVLIQGLGLKMTQVKMLRAIWKKMSQRRKGRRR